VICEILSKTRGRLLPNDTVQHPVVLPESIPLLADCGLVIVDCLVLIAYMTGERIPLQSYILAVGKRLLRSC